MILWQFIELASSACRRKLMEILKLFENAKMLRADSYK